MPSSDPIPDIPYLVRLLASGRNLPHSARLRNLLLAPIVERSNTIADPLDKEACWNAWLEHHGDQQTILKTYGSLPSEQELVSSTNGDWTNQLCDDDEPLLWGIVILSNGKRVVKGTPVVDVYISHEPYAKHGQLLDEVDPPSKQSEAMFEEMYSDTILPTLQKWKHSQALMFGINRCWAGTACRIVSQCLYESTCTRLFKRLVPTTPTTTTEKMAIAEHFIVRRATPQDCEMIMKFSPHQRPLDFYQSRTHYSVCIALKERPDSPVAWALTHDDLSVGSLFTLPEWRGQGLAKVIVRELEKQMAKEIPSHPLQHGQTFIHADCEAYNTSAVRFFTNMGFDSVIYSTWMAFRV